MTATKKSLYIRAILAMRDALPEFFKTSGLATAVPDASMTWESTEEQLSAAEDSTIVDVYWHIAKESCRLAMFETQHAEEQRRKDEADTTQNTLEVFDPERFGGGDPHRPREIREEVLRNNIRKATRNLDHAVTWVDTIYISDRNYQVDATFTGVPPSLEPYIVEAIKIDFHNIAAQAVRLQADALAALKEESDITVNPKEYEHDH